MAASIYRWPYLFLDGPASIYCIYRCRESVKNASTPDSGRGRLITPLRVRHQGKKFEFNWKHIILKRKRVSLYIYIPCILNSNFFYALMCKLGINSHSQIYSYSLGVVYECNFKMCNCRHQPKHSASMPATMIKIMSRMTIEGGQRRGGRLFPMRKLGIFRCRFVVDFWLYL